MLCSERARFFNHLWVVVVERQLCQPRERAKLQLLRDHVQAPSALAPELKLLPGNGQQSRRRPRHIYREREPSQTGESRQAWERTPQGCWQYAGTEYEAVDVLHSSRGGTQLGF